MDTIFFCSSCVTTTYVLRADLTTSKEVTDDEEVFLKRALRSVLA